MSNYYNVKENVKMSKVVYKNVVIPRINDSYFEKDKIYEIVRIMNHNMLDIKVDDDTHVKINIEDTDFTIIFNASEKMLKEYIENQV